MTRPFHRLAAVMAALVIALLANLTWIQVLDADGIRQRPGNTRLLLEQYNKMRGPILVEATPIASSTRTAGSNFYQRSYVNGPLYAAITGYYSLLYGASGMERAEDGVLSGDDPRLFVDRVQQLFAGRRQSGGAVSLTIDAAAQRAAFAGMDGRSGGVVALDVRTGAVLALVSTPSFDPQLLAPNDPTRVRVEYERLTSAASTPLVNRVLERSYSPGSVFELVAAAAALSSGRFTAGSLLPAPASYTAADTRASVRNPDGKPCNKARKITLTQALTDGCATAFAWLGDAIGVDAMVNIAEQLGFNSTISIPLRSITSHIPPNAAAMTAVGGPGVRVSVLQLALLAASVANGGTTMRPFLVRDVRGPDLSILERTTPSQLGTPMSTKVASTLANAMRAAAAKLDCPRCTPNPVVHALVSTVGATDVPTVVIAYSGSAAVAVVVERGTSASEDRSAAVASAMSVLASVRQGS